MATKVPHLWIVCAEPLTDRDERVIVSITSDGAHISDRSCPVEAGDHAFIRHRSFALFRKSRVVTIADMRAWQKNGYIKAEAAAAAPLITRIRNAALVSPYTPRDVQQAIRDCTWSL